MALTSEKSSAVALAVAATGVVYGDIGTSPLYAMKAVFVEKHGLALIPENIIGVVSLIIWSLILVVCFKYIIVMLNADNRGEGGVLALVSLAHSLVTKKSRWHIPLLILAVVGAGFFFGDGVISPAISVLSATEGLTLVTPVFKPYIIPISLGILFVLYSIQSKGTSGIGKYLGPIMVVWFVVIAGMGIWNIVRTPEILQAFNPVHAVRFMLANKFLAFLALGAIVLPLTGAESMYADLGHFGPGPIRRAWFFIVFPALICTYLGQGGLLLSNPAAISNPFFQQLDSWSVYPLVFLATIAVAVASQACIAGMFSLARQAIGLGLLPRMRIVHTSEDEIGQVYMPAVNWMQFATVSLTVILFGSSENLAGAYGLAVTGMMLITSFSLFFVMRYLWKTNLFLCILLPLFLVSVDLAFFLSNSFKIVSGGWFPMAIAGTVFLTMLTWRRGRMLIADSMRRTALPLAPFLESLFSSSPNRIKGTAVFLRGETDGVPQALIQNLSHNKVLHERVFFLTIHTREMPWVAPWERIKVSELGNHCYQIDVYYGFKNEPDIPGILKQMESLGHVFEMASTSFFVSRQILMPASRSLMMRWREQFFIWMYRNSRSAADYYRIPAARVIELGSRVEI